MVEILQTAWTESAFIYLWAMDCHQYVWTPFSAVKLITKQEDMLSNWRRITAIEWWIDGIVCRKELWLRRASIASQIIYRRSELHGWISLWTESDEILRLYQGNILERPHQVKWPGKWPHQPITRPRRPVIETSLLVVSLFTLKFCKCVMSWTI
jgi:hypothetical protein